MKRFVLLVILVVVGVTTWRIGTALSSDAIGMGVGVVFGMLAGIPAALLVLATARRSGADDDDRYERYQERMRNDRQLPAYPYQPPVIVVTSPQAPQAQMPGPQAPYFVPPGAGPGGQSGWGGHNGWDAPPASSGGRRFKMVGEKEEWIE